MQYEMFNAELYEQNCSHLGWKTRRYLEFKKYCIVSNDYS